MLIRLLVGLSGSEFSLGPGDRREFPQDEAERLVAAGYAVPHVESGPTETADKKQAPERRRAPAKRAKAA